MLPGGLRRTWRRWADRALRHRLSPAAPSPLPQGYLLGVVLQADRPACAALVHILGGVMISREADSLLTQRGLVASSGGGAGSAAPAQG